MLYLLLKNWRLILYSIEKRQHLFALKLDAVKVFDRLWKSVYETNFC
jgi:hypothetical protein